MVRTHSTMMLTLGDPAPDFHLPDTISGKSMSLATNLGKYGTLVMFVSNHCPFVVHILEEIRNIDRDYQEKGIRLFAISANDIESYPADAPDKMSELARAQGWSFPYLYDESQETAKSYGAACTPDFFLLDSEGALAFRGRMDGSSPGNDVPVTGQDLRTALDSVLAGQRVPGPQQPSIGCNIKWKPGNEPSYFG